MRVALLQAIIRHNHLFPQIMCTYLCDSALWHCRQGQYSRIASLQSQFPFVPGDIQMLFVTCHFAYILWIIHM
jgi:hypothetical protein